MTKTEHIQDLAKALLAAQTELRAVKKDSNNPHFKNDYASLGAVIEATRGILAKNGLIIIQTHNRSSEGDHCLLTTLLHISGQFIESATPLLLSKQDMQALGSATSYARRYALEAILNLNEEDDDGETAVEHKPHQKQLFQPKQTTADPSHAKAMTNPPFTKGYPSEPQLRRLYAICKKNDWNEAMLSEHLRTEYGISDKALIPTKAAYDEICRYIEIGGVPPDLNSPPHDDTDRLPF